MATTLGTRIKKKRIENGFTQEELAKKIKSVSQATIANWENDKKNLMMNI